MEPTTLNFEQQKALEVLNGNENVFLTGTAGSGKSFLIQAFHKQKTSANFPIVASTGAAAVLVRGRTFHSFFGLGILAGGLHATIEKAIRSSRVRKRISEVEGVIIDEVSMLSGNTLFAAEQVAKKIRGSSSPWGGLKVITVGDFFQLPPVTRSGEARDWAFKHNVWSESEFNVVCLKEVMRTRDEKFLKALAEVRIAKVSKDTDQYFKNRIQLDPEESFVGTRLYPRNIQADIFNQKKLAEINEPVFEFKTSYFGERSEDVEKAKPYFGFPEVLTIKKNALVMLISNDPLGAWYNGATGHIKEITSSEIAIEKLNGKIIYLKPIELEYIGPNGEVLASAKNFPLRLGYAVTIHKSQGMTLDRLRADLGGAWEHGQAYVALSRVKDPQGLSLLNWSSRSVVVDPEVVSFYDQLN